MKLFTSYVYTSPCWTCGAAPSRFRVELKRGLGFRIRARNLVRKI